MKPLRITLLPINYMAALTHESAGQIWEFSKDMVMIANRTDLYHVTQHEFATEGSRGGCIAIHFTTVAPFDIHLSTYDCSAYPQIKGLFFRILDAWNQSRASKNLAAEYACISHFYAIFRGLLLWWKTRGKSKSKTNALRSPKNIWIGILPTARWQFQMPPVAQI